MSENELYHYGVLGMKWGVRKRRTSANSVGLSKAAKRYDQKVNKGSFHNIVGYAYENMGYKKLANRQYKKGDYKEAKWKAKANRSRRIKKAYDSFLKDLDVLQKKGMGNDIDAVIKRSKIYDSQLSSIKDQYKEEISKAKQLLN